MVIAEIRKQEPKRRRRRGAKAREQGGATSGANRRQVNIDDDNDNDDGALHVTVTKTHAAHQQVTTENGEKASIKIKKGKHKIKPKKARPGEEGYLTPTQLRNARKRRAKQRAAEKNNGSPTSQSAGNMCDKKQMKSSSAGKHCADPSQKYWNDPKSCPAVRTAKQFFQSMIPTDRTFHIHLGPVKGWRTVSKLAVRRNRVDPTNAAPDIGLFAFGTHEIVASYQTFPAHHKSINTAIEVVREACKKFRILAYSEHDGSGLLRYLAVNVERLTGAVQITLVWNSKPTDIKLVDDDVAGKSVSAAASLQQLTKYLISAASNTSSFVLHSLWVHFHSSWKHNNAIFGREKGSWKLIHGPDSIDEVLKFDIVDWKVPPKIHLRFPPNVFRQANLDAFTHIIQSIRMILEKHVKAINKYCRCLELYGGVGTIGLHIADLMKSFVSSDENPHNLNCFSAAVASIADESVRQKIKNYVPKSALDMVNAGALSNADICIVDPPRKGLEEGVTSALIKQGPVKLLVYVSCGFDAFQRDCTMLVDGGWKLVHAEGHILFPGADAIESLAIFSRNDSESTAFC